MYILNHRALVVEEILMTEENYIDDLRLCIDVRTSLTFISCAVTFSKYVYINIYIVFFSY
jgi:hypothetical protein